MERRTTDAVILRIVDHGEGHRIVELLSPSEGLMRAFAPGAQRSRRRFGGALEPTHGVRATLRLRPGRDLWTLDEATVVAAHPGIRADLSAFARASLMIELVRALVRGGEGGAELYHLLVAGLGALDTGALSPWGLVAFELAALTAFGSPPRLDACARCGRVPSGGPARFAPAGGGLLCPACAPRWQAGDLTLSQGARKALVALAGAGARKEVLARAASLPEDPEALAEATSALARFTEALIGRPLKSREVLAQLG